MLLLFDIFFGRLVYFLRFGMLHQEKSGNPDIIEKVLIINFTKRKIPKVPFVFCFEA
jgi:hypothetical protein